MPVAYRGTPELNPPAVLLAAARVSRISLALPVTTAIVMPSKMSAATIPMMIAVVLNIFVFVASSNPFTAPTVEFTVFMILTIATTAATTAAMTTTTLITSGGIFEIIVNTPVRTGSRTVPSV
ncbi:hypothetical protein SDC9_119316 [bioreactor metagenome]|uniref:Uncharacterized protein n=1 Tax=bioreactor metagenome TaxID=1076179 RepID=A0A645C8M6_9ZZZZ